MMKQYKDDGIDSNDKHDDGNLTACGPAGSSKLETTAQAARFRRTGETTQEAKQAASVRQHNLETWICRFCIQSRTQGV